MPRMTTRFSLRRTRQHAFARLGACSPAVAGARGRAHAHARRAAGSRSSRRRDLHLGAEAEHGGGRCRVRGPTTGQGRADDGDGVVSGRMRRTGRGWAGRWREGEEATGKRGLFISQITQRLSSRPRLGCDRKAMEKDRRDIHKSCPPAYVKAPIAKDSTGRCCQATGETPNPQFALMETPPTQKSCCYAAQAGLLDTVAVWQVREAVP